MTPECLECEKQRESLLNELFPDKLPSELGDWTLSQLHQIKKSVASHEKNKVSISNSTAGQTAQNKLTVGNSLLGLKMNEIPGQPNTVNPALLIGNQLFSKKMNEL